MTFYRDNDICEESAGELIWEVNLTLYPWLPDLLGYTAIVAASIAIWWWI